MTPPTRGILAQDLSDATLGGIIEHLESDDAADLLESLSPRRRHVVVRVIQDVAAEIAKLLRYPADVAGGIMQTEYVAVPEGAPVEEAIEIIRNKVDEVSDLHSVFIIDQGTHLGRATAEQAYLDSYN